MSNTLNLMVLISAILNKKKDSKVGTAWKLGTLKYAKALKESTYEFSPRFKKTSSIADDKSGIEG